MAATGLEPELVDILAVFIIAGTVGVFVAKFARVPYTIALLIAGFVASLAGFETGIRLTHDVIIFVLLPPLLFEGAATTDLEAFRRDFPVVALLAVVGLAVAVIAVGAATAAVLGFPLLIALLFAVMAMPTDPVSVLALFEEIGAPERLSVLVEGESLLNDGVAVVLFTTLLALVSEGATVEELTEPVELATVLAEVLVSSLGGAAVDDDSSKEKLSSEKALFLGFYTVFHEKFFTNREYTVRCTRGEVPCHCRRPARGVRGSTSPPASSVPIVTTTNCTRRTTSSSSRSRFPASSARRSTSRGTTAC
jgi:hypothetical protein